MFFASYCTLLGFLVFASAIETAAAQFVLKPANPSYAVEGQNFTLEWTYTLGGSLFTVQFSNDTGGADDVIGIRVGPGKINSTQKYEARFRAQATSTRAELMILAVQLSDEAVYKLFLSSSKPAFFTHSVKVIVRSPPSNIITSSDQTITAPAELTLNCSADGKPEPTITWIRVSDNTVVYMPLNITGEKNEGSYRCTAVNNVGKNLTKVVNVTVLSPPSNIITSSDQTITAPAKLTLNCSADGKPEPTITWTRVSDNTVVFMPLNIAGGRNGESYRCTADNGVRKNLTKVVNITVLYPAEATRKGRDYCVLEGKSEILTCPVVGNPEPNITWYNSSGASISSKKELEVRKSGCYICVANNSIGKLVNIKECLIVRRGTCSTTTTASTTVPDRKQIPGQLTIRRNYMEEYKDLNSASSITFVAEFMAEMTRRCVRFPWYIGAKVTNLSRGSGFAFSRESVIVQFILFIKTAEIQEHRLEKLKAAISANGTFGRYKAGDLVLLSDESTTSTTPGSPKSTVSVGPPWVIIGAVAGGVVLLAIIVGVLTWWVHKQRKCRKDTKIHNSHLGRHDDEGAYAQSGPPAANGSDGVAEQETEVAAAIPTYAVVDKSKKSKTQTDERPPEYAVVDKSRKKEEQGAAPIPTYAAVDKSKKKKKSREEVPAAYAEVEKSKKKKKKVDDKNLYETLDEPKKEKKPGELLYADLGDFQNPSMPAVSISPQPLPAIKKADPYERTDYADITQFRKGNATLPPNDGNGDTEMKPKKKEIKGNDKETPI